MREKSHFLSVGVKKYVSFNEMNQRVIMYDDIKITIYLNNINNLFMLINYKKIFLKELSKKRLLNYLLESIKKLEFEKWKKISFNNMLDNKLI